MEPRYLTKSRFKLALECPAKLYYTGKKDTYYDTKFDNDFLAELAEGGFQVGELAKCYYPDGIEVPDLEFDIALAKTSELLQRDTVTIFEAAFLVDNLFIRADIVEKNGNNIRLIEVKAKSFDSTAELFTNKEDLILSKWEPYLYDVAFQKYVIQKSYPHLRVVPYLLLSDKSTYTTVEGLNQSFFIYQDGGRYKVKRSATFSQDSLGAKIMTEQNVDALCEKIIHDPIYDFENRVVNFVTHYIGDNKIPVKVGVACGKCEFRPNSDLLAQGFRSGFNECWESTKLSQEKIDNELLLSLWDFRRKPDLINEGRYTLSDLTREDLESKTKKAPATDPWLSRVDRQWLQIEKSRNKDNTSFFDAIRLGAVIGKWNFPLHFIDFETTAVAIPFNSGRRPYEQIAFQFSHHLVSADGSIRHQGEWISLDKGSFPNYEFVRELKKQLETDNGTIFRYASHENTILNVIYRQLKDSTEDDKEELCDWIKTITKSSSSSSESWIGERNMVDLRDLILKYYYNPLTRGSNSIKHVLRAVIQTSDFLQEKYSKPIYGNEIASFNFKDHIWIKKEAGSVVNPYHLLPAIHAEGGNEQMDEFLIDEEVGIADGGAAMIAYARMQFTEISELERRRITEALLRYCELDTFAMVMLYEAFKDWCK